MRCSKCGSLNPAEVVRCEECGAKLASQQKESDLDDQETAKRRPRNRSTEADAVERSPRRRPRQDLDDEDEEEYDRPRRRRRSEEDEVVSTLIPYRNPKALISYYVGIFSLVPVLGFLLAPVALILGILGLSYRRANPEAKGAAHAWVGIVLGSISLFAHLAVVGLIVFFSLKK